MVDSLKSPGSRRALVALLGGAGAAALASREAEASYLFADHIPYMPPFTGTVQRTIGGKLAEFISVKDFGAVGDGTADDTTAVQAAVTAAAPKGVVFFPAGIYKITSSINITSGINLLGVGFEGIFKGTTLGSVIKVMANIVGFNITCDDSVTIEKLEFFGGTGGNTATLVKINTDNSTSQNSNYGSIIRDCMFTVAARGIQALSILNFVFDNCNFYNLTTLSCQVEAANSLGNGDSTVVNCTFSGGPTAGHLATGTVGGLRIENNKFNMPGTANMVAMAFGQGGTVSALGVSPLIIIGNSIEGVQIGILFQRTGGGTMTSDNIIINGNEIVVAVASGSAILSQVTGGNANAWVLGGIISGNFFFAGNTGISIISLDAAQDINIAANQFMANAAATAVTVGATTARIGQNANAKGLNVT